MNVNEILGKRVALLVTGADENGNEESAVFTGIAEIREDRVVLLRSPGEPINLLPEWLERIRPVLDQESRTILLNSEFLIQLSIGNLPADADLSEYISTGLKWPAE